MANRTIAPEPRSAQAKFLFSRQLKVRKSYYDYQLCDFKPHQQHTVAPPVPWVQIKGYWLNQAGFTIGKALSVEVREGCIVISTQDDCC